MHGIGGVNDGVVMDWVSGTGYMLSKLFKKNLSSSDVSSLSIGPVDKNNIIVTRVLSPLPKAITTWQNYMNDFYSNFYKIMLSPAPTAFNLDKFGTATFTIDKGIWINVFKSEVDTLQKAKDWVDLQVTLGNPISFVYERAAHIKNPSNLHQSCLICSYGVPLTSLVTTPSLDTPHGVYSVVGNMVGEEFIRKRECGWYNLCLYSLVTTIICRYLYYICYCF